MYIRPANAYLLSNPTALSRLICVRDEFAFLANKFFYRRTKPQEFTLLSSNSPSRILQKVFTAWVDVHSNVLVRLRTKTEDVKHLRRKIYFNCFARNCLLMKNLRQMDRL